uniref:hypothetical protein n=1 Tax=Ruegeria arenilitoris TaxID=1173585 RepID=UPI00147A171B|nr:hypothetical protein [Ruegeria arenilitoris]
MIRIPLLLAPLLLPACMAGAGAVDRLSLEYQVGEELMNDCRQNGQRCDDYLAFKERFEREARYLTTFERSLAAHKARVAAGGAV